MYLADGEIGGGAGAASSLAPLLIHGVIEYKRKYILNLVVDNRVYNTVDYDVIFGE